MSNFIELDLGNGRVIYPLSSITGAHERKDSLPSLSIDGRNVLVPISYEELRVQLLSTPSTVRDASRKTIDLKDAARYIIDLEKGEAFPEHEQLENIRLWLLEYADMLDGTEVNT